MHTFSGADQGDCKTALDDFGGATMVVGRFPPELLVSRRGVCMRIVSQRERCGWKEEQN